jgi:hypothetical protein
MRARLHRVVPGAAATAAGDAAVPGAAAGAGRRRAAHAEVARCEQTTRYQVSRAFREAADELAERRERHPTRQLSLDEAKHRRGRERALTSLTTCWSVMLLLSAIAAALPSSISWNRPTVKGRNPPPGPRNPGDLSLRHPRQGPQSGLRASRPAGSR